VLGGARGRRELSGMIIKAYKADFCSVLGHTLRMSAFGGRTDIFGCGSKSPLIARSGHVVGNELILPTHLEIRQPTSPIA
jgi:hypothetical protein